MSKFQFAYLSVCENALSQRWFRLHIKGFGFLPHSRSNGLFVVTQKVLLGINRGFSILP